MAEVNVRTYRIVFNCLSCGALLSVDSTYSVSCSCDNCGAAYDHSETRLYRYGAGRPPTQWVINGYRPATEK